MANEQPGSRPDPEPPSNKRFKQRNAGYFFHFFFHSLPLISMNLAMYSNPSLPGTGKLPTAFENSRAPTFHEVDCLLPVIGMASEQQVSSRPDPAPPSHKLRNAGYFSTTTHYDYYNPDD